MNRMPKMNRFGIIRFLGDFFDADVDALAHFILFFTN